MHDWIDRCSPGARVLDLFCANGAFAIRAAQAGATEVVGIDAEASRITVANLLAEIIEPYVNASMRFHVADVHDVEKFGNQFDIVMCFGGLYHISDPVSMLERLRALTGRYLLLQTSHVVPGLGSWGWFRLPTGHRTQIPVWPSETGGWSLTAGCYRRLIRNAGFEC